MFGCAIINPQTVIGSCYGICVPHSKSTNCLLSTLRAISFSPLIHYAIPYQYNTSSFDRLLSREISNANVKRIADVASEIWSSLENQKTLTSGYYNGESWTKHINCSTC